MSETPDAHAARLRAMVRSIGNRERTGGRGEFGLSTAPAPATILLSEDLVQCHRQARTSQNAGGWIGGESCSDADAYRIKPYESPAQG